MGYFSNKEIKTAPDGYVPAQIDADGKCTGPRCCGQKMQPNGGCGIGCCDDYLCENCGHTVRIEWPD